MKIIALRFILYIKFLCWPFDGFAERSLRYEKLLPENYAEQR
jgi:hypothetical protein